MARVTPGMLSALLAGARSSSGCASSCRPTTPGTRRWCATLLYGADATDDMVRTGAEIMHASTVRSFLSFMPALGEHDKREELAALARVPVEILVGDSDNLTPRRHSLQLAEALPDATLHEVERTGHMLTQERPQLVDGRDRTARHGRGRGPGRGVSGTIAGMTLRPLPSRPGCGARRATAGRSWCRSGWSCCRRRRCRS